MHRTMTGISQAMAVAGGLVLGFLILMTCVSITGRGINTFLHGAFMESLAPAFSTWLLGLGVGPVKGDFELIEAGMPFAIFAFLPLAQIRSSHATVDIFTQGLSPGILRVLQAVIEVVFALVLVTFAVKLYEGMASKMRYGETTFLLQFPIWWAYALALFGSVLSAVVGVYMAGVRVVEMVTGRQIAVGGSEAGH